jgi:hypothetical protein
VISKGIYSARVDAITIDVVVRCELSRPVSCVDWLRVKGEALQHVLKRLSSVFRYLTFNVGLKVTKSDRGESRRLVTRVFCGRP